jgi:hypothetical protein
MQFEATGFRLCLLADRFMMCAMAGVLLLPRSGARSMRIDLFCGRQFLETQIFGQKHFEERRMELVLTLGVRLKALKTELMFSVCPMNGLK